MVSLNSTVAGHVSGLAEKSMVEIVTRELDVQNYLVRHLLQPGLVPKLGQVDLLPFQVVVVLESSQRQTTHAVVLQVQT